MVSRVPAREFAVIGLGRFGSSLAQRLVASGHTVLGIDSDDSIVQRYSHEITQAVALDSTDVEALREIDIATFPTVVVAIGSGFEASLLTTAALKEVGVGRIICKALHKTQKDILLKLGAHEVILPEYQMGELLADRLANPLLVNQINLDAKHGVVEIAAPDTYHGRQSKELDLENRYGVRIVAVLRSGRLHADVPDSFEILLGDLLVVLGPTAGLRMMSQES